MNHGPHRQVQLAPPGDVGDVAECADHGDAAALFRIGKRMRLHRHPHTEERRHHVRAKERLIPLIVGMRNECDAGGNQLRPRCIDFDGPAQGGRHIRREPEFDPVVGARHLAILELGLRDRGLEIDVPERRCLHLIREAALQQVEKRELRDALRAPADRRVGHRPVDRQPQGLPELLEGLLVFRRQPRTELDEVRARHRHRRLGRLRRRLERRIVGQRRVAPHAVVVLHAALGRQTVVVPSHRIEDGLAAHALKVRDQVGMRVREAVADVQRSADRRRWRVDREDLSARSGAVEPVDTGLFPARHPFGFKPLEGRLFR